MNGQEFVKLVEQHRHQFFRFVKKNLWKPEEAEDVFASAILTAYEKREQFTLGTNFRAWMYKILINKCFSANRETKTISLEEESLEYFLPSKEENKYQQVLQDPYWFVEECDEEIIRALRRLSTAERSCLLLLALEKYSYKEIAETLEMPIGTIMTHLARGRAKLREALARYAKEKGIVSH